MRSFFRGSNVHIQATFYDSDGGIIAPSGANVTLSYVPKNSDLCDPTFITYGMTTSGTAWVYDWDSSVAEPGMIYAHAEGVDSPASTVDFQFRLIANRANKELSGDDAGSGY